MRYPAHLMQLILMFKKLPGVGNRSAERFAFHLLNWNQKELSELGRLIGSFTDQMIPCAECGCLQVDDGCPFCQSAQRDRKVICVIATPKDAFSIEETGEYKGLYHVLGSLLSPLDKRGPQQLGCEALKKRISLMGVEEIIIGLDATLEGDATALFLKEELAAYSLRISRLAFGLPMGSSFDYVDGGTLARAFAGRGFF